MPNNEQFSNQRGKEDEYFHHRDRELLEESRRRAEAERHLNRLSAASGIVDREILHDLLNLGYDSTTVTALPHIPLVRIAWSDGTVSQLERQRILHIARLHGMEDEDPGRRFLSQCLDKRPSDEFFRLTLHALQALLKALSADERERRRKDLILHCRSVASASGGIWGLGKTSRAEQLVIDEVTEAIRTN